MRSSVTFLILVVGILSNIFASESGKAAASAYDAGREADRYQRELNFDKGMEIERNIQRQNAVFYSRLTAGQKEGYRRIDAYIKRATSNYYSDCLNISALDMYTPMPSEEDANNCYYFKMHGLGNNISDEQIEKVLKILNMSNFSIGFARQCIQIIISEMTN